MAALRISVLRKSLSRHPLSSFGRFCSSKSDDSNSAPTSGDAVPGKPPMLARGEETKGALKTFMALNESTTASTGLWAKLRQDSKPDRPTEPRPWTQAGGARMTSAGRGGSSPSEGGSAESSGSGDRRNTFSSPPQRKAFNPRSASGKRKPSQGSGGNSDGGGSGPGGAGSYLGGGRKRRGATEEEEDNYSDDDEDDEDRRSVKLDEDGEEEIPEEVMAALDEDKFARDIENGKSVDTSTMDTIDAFFANAYFESHKTTSGTVRDVLVSQDFRRVRLPKPRSIRELVGAITPNITSVPANTDAHRVGQDAFSVLSKNNHFSEKDKAFIANGIAKKLLQAEKWQAEENLRFQTSPDEFDLEGYLTDVFHPKFRRGYEMYLEEKKIARRLLAEGAGPSTYSAGFTDWNNDAIADEDDFNLENEPILADEFPDLQEEEDAQALLDDEPKEIKKKKKTIRDVKKKKK